MLSDEVPRCGQPSLPDFRGSPLLFSCLLSFGESLFLGKAGCNYVQNLRPSYSFIMAFVFLKRGQFFVDWEATPMNFCKKKLRYSYDELYQTARLDGKALTLSSTQYYENRIHTSS